MADVIDLDTRRRGSSDAQPPSSATCTFDVAPGVVTVTIATPDGEFAFGVSPEGAEQMAHRLTVAAIRARLASENGDHNG